MTEDPRTVELNRLDRRIAEAEQEARFAAGALQNARNKLIELSKKRIAVESCT
jgi:hypothetical protein